MSRAVRQLIAFAVAGLILGCARGEPHQLVEAVGASQATSPTAAPIPAATLDSSRTTAIVTAVRRVAPSVVSIHVTSRRRVESPGGFWDFFLVPQARERLVDGFGTGFVLRSDGIVVTNQHVVGEAERITVTLPDGSELAATLLGEDPTTDIAVLRVDRSGLPVAPVGRSADLMIGEWVIALGNPFAYLLGNAEPTVTAGVVSAVGRNILPNRQQTGLYLDMIQTDAAINPGNSGGPLTNALGEVVGMNSSIFTSTGGSIGLGFAIPVERVIRVAEEIVRDGMVRRPWVGLDVAGADGMRDWRTQGGVPVTRVAPDGPAARAGLRSGQILVEANGRPLRNYLDWEAVKLDLRVGDPVSVAVRDGGSTVSRRIVTDDLPTVIAERVNVLRGLELITVNEAVRSERGVNAEHGALIVSITDAARAQTGLTRDDVIIGINRVAITSAEQVARVLEGIQSRQVIRVYFERGGGVGYTDLVVR